jgi:hypothetical protein
MYAYHDAHHVDFPLQRGIGSSYMVAPLSVEMLQALYATRLKHV